MSTPFLSFYTPTYKRPQALARCLASVAAQTDVALIEQIVIPDHVGIGVDGMFAAVPRYGAILSGRYVHLLADDDALASPHVVEIVRHFAEAHDNPPVILVRVVKGGVLLPSSGEPWPPVCGQIDLGCLIVRSDIWKAHAADYGQRYEGDYDFAHALFEAGLPALMCDMLFLCGDVMRGAPEA